MKSSTWRGFGGSIAVVCALGGAFGVSLFSEQTISQRSLRSCSSINRNAALWSYVIVGLKTLSVSTLALEMIGKAGESLKRLFVSITVPSRAEGDRNRPLVRLIDAAFPGNLQKGCGNLRGGIRPMCTAKVHVFGMRTIISAFGTRSEDVSRRGTRSNQVS